MNRVKNQLKEFKKTFDPLLFGFLDKKQKEVKKVSPFAQILVQEIARTIKAGGKRIRPAILFYAFKACGGKDEKAALNLGMALEIFHTFCLIHDDILDKAEKRRGENSVFKKEGLGVALLAGDLGFVLAHSLINQREILRLFNLLNQEVVLGEYLDVLCSGRASEQVSKDLILKIMEYKTARYSFARPLQIGATLAGANAKILKGFWQYGMNLGLAFQIQDDILGVFGKEESLGKSVLSDLQEDKKTLLYLETIKLTDRKEKKEFLKIWGNKSRTKTLVRGKKATKKDLAWVKRLMRNSGALEETQKQAKDLALKAKKNLVKLDIQKKEKNFFLNLADFIIKRNF